MTQRPLTEQLAAANRTCAQLQAKVNRLEEERGVLLRALDLATGGAGSKYLDRIKAA